MIRSPLFSTALFAGSLALCSCDTINSGLRVQPAQQFVLGGGQRGAFRLEASNVGEIPVMLYSRREGAADTPLGALQPGERETIQFEAGRAAVIANQADREAVVKARITGDTDLGMRYEPTIQAP